MVASLAVRNTTVIEADMHTLNFQSVVSYTLNHQVAPLRLLALGSRVRLRAPAFHLDAKGILPELIYLGDATPHVVHPTPQDDKGGGDYDSANNDVFPPFPPNSTF